jgi:hypothetical protein
VTAAERYTHCPNCLAEYREGFTICADCGSLLVPGPSPTLEPLDGIEGPDLPGRVEVVRADDPSAEEPDRFALEETPIVLTDIVREDVDAFLAALDEQEIGARRGRELGDGGVEVLVHAANLIDAQAVLVEFTGDVALVDDIAVDPEAEDDAWAVVTWIPLRDAGARANRLRRRGVDVRLELPADGSPDAWDAQAAILVANEDLEAARRILGIEY